MKTTNKFCTSWSVVALAISIVCSAAAVESPSKDTSDMIQRLQEQLNEQAKRIDRLYRALGPRLEEMEDRAAFVEKQQKEDKALALEEITRVKDESLSSIGCVNPAAPQFAALTEEGGIRLYDAAGKAIKNFLQSKQHCTAVAISPNGRELLAGTETGALLIWDVSTGNSLILRTNTGQKVARVCWVGKNRVAWGSTTTYWKDGKAFEHDKPAGSVISRENGKVLWTFRGFVRNDFYTLAGAQDGARLAVLEIPDLPRGGFILDSASGEVLQTCYDKAHGSGPLSIGFSPDGKTLAMGYAPNDVILWSAITGEKQKLLKGHWNWVVSLAFSADGKRLISGAGDSTARIWEVESGNEIGRIRFEGPSTYVDGVGLSPGGDIAFALVEGMLVVAKVKPPGAGK